MRRDIEKWWMCFSKCLIFFLILVFVANSPLMNHHPSDNNIDALAKIQFHFYVWTLKETKQQQKQKKNYLQTFNLWKTNRYSKNIDRIMFPCKSCCIHQHRIVLNGDLCFQSYNLQFTIHNPKINSLQMWTLFDLFVNHSVNLISLKDERGKKKHK